MNNSAVKSIVLSEGWNDIVEFLRANIETDLVTDGLKVEEIGLHYLARQMAKERLNIAITRLQSFADQQVLEQKNYR